MVQPQGQSRKRGRKSIIANVATMLARCATITCQTSHIVIPDVLIAQILWGGNREKWPTRWRREIARAWKRTRKAMPSFQQRCPPTCPLHERSDVPHRHLEIKPKGP